MGLFGNRSHPVWRKKEKPHLRGGGNHLDPERNKRSRAETLPFQTVDNHKGGGKIPLGRGLLITKETDEGTFHSSAVGKKEKNTSSNVKSGKKAPFQTLHTSMWGE